MTDESQETRQARFEERISNRLDHLEKVADDHQDKIYGEDGRSGLLGDFKDLKTENRYLRIIYVLATALALPVLNSIITKLGFGPIKVGGG